MIDDLFGGRLVHGGRYPARSVLVLGRFSRGPGWFNSGGLVSGLWSSVIPARRPRCRSIARGWIGGLISGSNGSVSSAGSCIRDGIVVVFFSGLWFVMLLRISLSKAVAFRALYYGSGSGLSLVGIRILGLHKIEHLVVGCRLSTRSLPSSSDELCDGYMA